MFRTLNQGVRDEEVSGQLSGRSGAGHWCNLPRRRAHAGLLWYRESLRRFLKARGGHKKGGNRTREPLLDFIYFFWVLLASCPQAASMSWPKV